MKNLFFAGGSQAVQDPAETESSKDDWISGLQEKYQGIRTQLVHMGQALVDARSTISNTRDLSEVVAEGLQRDFLDKIPGCNSIKDLEDAVEEAYQKTDCALEAMADLGAAVQSHDNSDHQSRYTPVSSVSNAVHSVIQAISVLGGKKSSLASAIGGSVELSSVHYSSRTSEDLLTLNNLSAEASRALANFAIQMEEACYVLSSCSRGVLELSQEI